MATTPMCMPRTRMRQATDEETSLVASYHCCLNGTLVLGLAKRSAAILRDQCFALARTGTTVPLSRSDS